MKTSDYYFRLAKRRLWWSVMSTSLKRQTRMRQLEEIVSEHYHSVLLRRPTPFELHYWVDGLAFGGMSLDTLHQTVDNKDFPPKELMLRVSGSKSAAAFEFIGKALTTNLTDALQELPALKDGARILDFGCGCGRVIRYFHSHLPQCEFHGSDIDPEAIGWCDENLSYARFAVNGHLPPLPYDDQSFDFIYSISIFTHLPEDMQFAWLEDLRRVTKINGHLILTIHGEEILPTELNASQRLRDKGFYYHKAGGTDGLPEFYQNTWHTDEYIQSQWSRFFKIKQHKKRGINNHQDLILCQRVA